MVKAKGKYLGNQGKGTDSGIIDRAENVGEMWVGRGVDFHAVIDKKKILFIKVVLHIYHRWLII